MQVTGSNLYTLSIRLATDGFSFSIYNPIRDSLVLSQEWEVETELSLTANVRQAVKELEFLSYSYKQINVSLVNRRFTLIPLELFNKNQATTYFYYNFSPKESEVVLYDTLPKNGSVLLYAIDKSLDNFLHEVFPQVQLHSSATFLIEHFAVKCKVGSEKKMFVNLLRGLIEVYAYERGELILLNAYDCKTNADRMYYLLYAWKQLGMDQQSDELCVVGNDEYKIELVDGIRHFIRHITQLNPVNEFIYP